MNQEDDITEFEIGGVTFRLLTVNRVQSHFIKHPDKPLKMFTTQDLEDLPKIDPDGIDVQAFIFNGNLRQETQETRETNEGIRYSWNTVIHKGWLGNENNTGPYTKNSQDESMYYLEGKFTYNVNDNPIDWEEMSLQICSVPLNIVSINCVNGFHCWVRMDSIVGSK